MDERFLEVYEDAAEGALERARRKLERLRRTGADPARVEELAVFLESFAHAPEELPAAGAHMDVTHPAHGLAARPRRDAVPLRCLACGHEEHVRRVVVLNRRFTTFFGFDMVDRSAVTYACARCGHILWFGRPAPGFVQAWAQQDQERLAAEGEGDGACGMCGYAGLHASKALLNTSLLTFLGLDWLDGGARVERCRRCGLLHWSGTRPGEASPWRGRARPAGPPPPCPACGRAGLHAHRALLNTRAATALGLDWLDAGAWVVRCEDCHAMTWWTRRPQATDSR